MKSLIEKIAYDLNLDPSYVSNIVDNSQFLYKSYYIPKKNGGERLVQQPSPELKTLQYWVIENILVFLPISNAAMAYRKGSSIKKNALVHSDKSFILHTDIVDFFPSISSKSLELIINKSSSKIVHVHDYPDSFEVIKKICFLKGHAIIGAVSSPMISNIVMYSFDDEVSSYAIKNGLSYTRYADDIYISSARYISESIICFVTDMLSKYHFTMNAKKTYFLSKKVKLCVTGLTVVGKNYVTINKKMKLLIRKLIYNKLVHNSGNSDVILGYLSFIKDIDVGYYNLLLTKYSTYCSGDIIQNLRKV
ncbi:hypothetical protein SDC9_55957 [bioreactor metagenome]|uniref:Reverse transcriptase domain-containing protein n=1 Tax=bioreactor metagenome TaxID=1076179 RepID=A0A644X0G0_9ZZZZ